MIMAVHTYEETAQALGLPVWMVRNIEQRAIARIQRRADLRRLWKEAEKAAQHERQEYKYPDIQQTMEGEE